MKDVAPLFKRISIRNLEGEEKSNIAQTIIGDIDTGLEYWSQMILAVVIATLGLLVNATPVVIGAMLIAPIMIPIQGVAFAISTGNRKLFFDALKLLLMSIGCGIALGAILTWIVPLSEVTNEIAARTTPTLVDLGIAIASGMIAFLAFGYKKMVGGLAGVAMAASLVPPLGVIGIGIAFGSTSIARGSSLLFLTNLVAIIIAGIAIFYMFGFVPNQQDDIKRSVLNTGYVIFVLLLLCIPLASSLININQNISLTKRINNTIETSLAISHPSAKIKDIQYQKNGQDVQIDLDITIPQEQVTSLTDEYKSALTNELVESTKNNVDMSMQITPITSAYKEQVVDPSPQELVRTYIYEYLQAQSMENIHILEVDYYTDEVRIARATIYIDQENLNKVTLRKNLLAYIQSQEDLVDILAIDRQEVQEESTITETNEDIQFLTRHFTSFFSEQTKLEGVSLRYITTDDLGADLDSTSPDVSLRPRVIIQTTVNTSLTPEDIRDRLASRKENIQGYFADIVELEADVQYREEVRI